MTANTHISDEVFLDRLEDLLDAFESKDDARVKKIASTIPLTPAIALQRKHYMSKSDIVNLGFDMSLVEEELGIDWYEKP